DCADGFFCVQGAQGALCWPLCQSFADCTEDEYCETPAWEYMEVGLCFCTDGDGDGVCRADDCDDASPSVGAGVPEVCGDGTDNDCDGESDEGCGAGEDTGAPGEDAGAPGNDLATAPDLEDDSSPVHPLVLGAGGGGSCAAGPATAPAAGLLAALALAGLRRLRQRS
ncbi:MAG: putative metal-binding motif-containing protein, partial [Deltaproteobacteria bacterium]|nr:putative metal-binding motif-containing protein [Deltaproteobacteria bacterium]